MADYIQKAVTARSPSGHAHGESNVVLIRGGSRGGRGQIRVGPPWPKKKINKIIINN